MSTIKMILVQLQFLFNLALSILKMTFQRDISWMVKQLLTINEKIDFQDIVGEVYKGITCQIVQLT